MGVCGNEGGGCVGCEVLSRAVVYEGRGCVLSRAMVYRRDGNWKLTIPECGKLLSTGVLRRVIIFDGREWGCGAAIKKSNSIASPSEAHSLIIKFARTRNPGGASTASRPVNICSRTAPLGSRPGGDQKAPRPHAAPKSRSCSPMSGAAKRS